MKNILLTFDLEEFDLPLEFGKNISEENQFKISREGLDNILKILEIRKIPATFFTTANFARKYPQLIRELSKKGHEIASHGDIHSEKITLKKIEKSKNDLERISGSKINGFRAPRFDIKDISGLARLGFKYDSSIHPTWIPGRYMNLFKKRGIYTKEGILEIPLSTLPLIRLPIFWLAFKNLGIGYSKIFTKINLLFSNYNMLVFHPWEFANLKEINIPRYIKKMDGQILTNNLEKYIQFCNKNYYSFKTISEYLKITL